MSKPKFRVDIFRMNGNLKRYETDSAEFVAKYIRYMERDKVDNIESIFVLTKAEYRDVYTSVVMRGHRIAGLNGYVVDENMYYDIDNEMVWGINQLMDYYNEHEDNKEYYPNFWQWLDACQTRNNGTLHII